MTTKTKSFKITCAEVSYFEIEVDAQNEDEAIALVNEDINAHEIVYEEVKEWQVDHAEEIV